MSRAMAMRSPGRPAKVFLRTVLAALVFTAGVLHFWHAEDFARVVPNYLPWPYALVYVSGYFEIAGAIGLLWPQTRRAAGWGLIALFVTVFPANVYMAVNQIPLGDMTPSPLALWLRLPFQLVLIVWAHWAARE